MIGIERERRKGKGPYRALAGVRTCALIAVAGAGAGTRATDRPLLIAAGAALLVALAVTAYARDRSDDPGVTTEVAMFVTYLLGVTAMSRPEVAAGSAAVITIILASRGSLHRFAVDILSDSELRDGLLFCGAALVILPLLPERIGPWLPVLNPRRLWGLVVLFMAVQAAATSVLSLGSTGMLPASELVTAVLAATSTNTQSKLVAAFGTGGVGYDLRVMAGLLLVLAAMWSPLLWR